jgi:hypothetical protein
VAFDERYVWGLGQPLRRTVGAWHSGGRSFLGLRPHKAHETAGIIPRDNVGRKRLDGVSEAHEALSDMKICGDARPERKAVPASLLKTVANCGSVARVIYSCSV